MSDYDRVIAIEAEQQRLRAEMELQPQLWIPNLIRIAGLEQDRAATYARLREGAA
ncbi:hypothetical protein [Inquilinus limosus]|uniref:hypothetical protein n=1 Tax=Inquilinus limosus TaxID=171674 RepID=UPI0013770B86|nr:hypothetical protein [Inquilinus limosus]